MENQNKTDLKLEEWVVSSRCDVEWRNGTVEGIAAHLWAYGSGPKKTRQTKKKHNIQVSSSQNGLMKHDLQRSSVCLVRKPVSAKMAGFQKSVALTYFQSQDENKSIPT